MADIEAGARAICYVSPCERQAMASELCRRAGLADRYRKRLGRSHPDFGTGTLMSAAARFQQVPRPAQMNRGYLAAVALICMTLHAQRDDQEL